MKLKYVFIPSLLLVVIGAFIKIMLKGGGTGVTIMLAMGALGALVSLVLFLLKKIGE